MTIENKFVETLSEVPPTCLEENGNGNKCVRRSGHEGDHKAAGPHVRGVEIWNSNGPIAKREAGESTTQFTLLEAPDDRKSRSVDADNERSEEVSDSV